jgi:hypothetical protein
MGAVIPATVVTCIMDRNWTGVVDIGPAHRVPLIPETVPNIRSVWEEFILVSGTRGQFISDSYMRVGTGTGSCVGAVIGHCTGVLAIRIQVTSKVAGQWMCHPGDRPVQLRCKLCVHSNAWGGRRGADGKCVRAFGALL